jgi:peptidoglycan-associated lipoprotein
VCLFLEGLTIGCKKKAEMAAPPDPPPQKAPTASLIAEPTSIERGQSATLRWSSSDATDLNISYVGDVKESGSREVRPLESTEYRFTAIGPLGVVVASATVNVRVPPPPLATPSPRVKALAERVEMEVADAFFDYDKSNIRQDAQAVLAKDASALQSIFTDFPEAVIYLQGHCDERGSAEYNLGLGEHRAVSTSVYLQTLGIPTDRLITLSFGKKRPQCTETTEECWQKNRRVHFSATKSETQSPEAPVVSSNYE